MKPAIHHKVKIRAFMAGQMVYHLPFLVLANGQVFMAERLMEKGVNTKLTLVDDPMLFSGMQDEDGKDIWAGDFIEQNVPNQFGSYEKAICAVFFNDVNGAFECTRLKPRPDEPPTFSIGAKCKVIGNFYQNKEILA